MTIGVGGGWVYNGDSPIAVNSVPVTQPNFINTAGYTLSVDSQNHVTINLTGIGPIQLFQGSGAPTNTFNIIIGSLYFDVTGGNVYQMQNLPPATWVKIGSINASSFANISGVAAPNQLPAATASAQGAIVLDGDLGNTAASPEVISTHLASPLPVAQGGTGADLASTGGASQVLKQTSSGADVTVAQLAFSDISGSIGLAQGGTGSNLSATGGTSRVLKQTSSGADVTVAQLAASDLSNGVNGSGGVVLATSPTLTTPTIAGGALSGVFTGNLTLTGTVTAGTLAGTTINSAALSGVFTGNPAFNGSPTVANLNGIYFVDGTTYTSVAGALTAINATSSKTGIIFTTVNETFSSNPFAGLNSLMDVTIYMACTWTTSVQLLITTSGIVIKGSGRIGTGCSIVASGLASNTSVVCIGDDLTSYQGTRLEDLTVDASDISGSNCLEMYGAAENCGAVNCVFESYGGYGVYMHGQNTTNFEFDHNVISPSTISGTTSCIGIYLDDIGGNANFINRCTIVGNVASSGLQAAGIELYESNCHISNCHVESCTDAIYFNTGANGMVDYLIDGGGVGTATNTIHINTGGGVALHHIGDGSGTNAITNATTGLTLAWASISNELEFYYVGGLAADGEVYYYSGGKGMINTAPLNPAAALAGFGNGSSGTAVTTTTKSSGSGPATPQTVVNYVQMYVGGTKFWIPLVQ